MINALTIDLEDWYQGLTSTSPQIDRWPEFESRILGNTGRLLGLLAQAGVKATFFVLGYVADQFPDLVKKIAEDGHEIALHSYYHRRVHQFTPPQFRAEILKGMKAVQNACGNLVQGYRAPMFSINRSSTWVLKELREMGFRYDSSIFPIDNRYYGIPGAPRFPYHPFDDDGFVEFPLSTIRFLNMTWPIAGGFYGRALPYPVFRAAIQNLNRQGYPAIIYFHPWEFDVDQRYWNVTLRERITHYYGRGGLERKFKRLLQDFEFAPLLRLVDSVALRSNYDRT